MNNTLILHSYTNTRIEDQKETWKSINNIKTKYTVISRELFDGNDYDLFIKEFWNKGDTIITVEQDVVPSLNLIKELEVCPEPWCCHQYKIKYKDNVMPSYMIMTGLGLTKFSPKAQNIAETSLWFNKGIWINLDSRITGCLTAKNVLPHVHKQVKHNHIAVFR